MTIEVRRRRVSARRPVARVLLVLADVAVAAALALVVNLLGVWRIDRSDPPYCYNYFDTEIDCSLQTPMNVATFAVFTIVLLGLLSWQALRSGRQRD